MKTCKKNNCNRIDVRSSGLCKKHHHSQWLLNKTGHVTQEKISYEMCQAPECNRPTAKRRNQYCEMHHGRLRRNGTFDLLPSPQDGEIRQHSAGYILEYRNNHIKFGTGYYYQHRLNFYDFHGDGPFKCFDCNKDISWEDMHVHHLDENKQNNEIKNLAASCPKCNHNASIGKCKKGLRKINKQNNISYKNVVKHICDWSDELNIPPHVIKWRVQNWGVDKALSEPYKPYKK